MARLIFNAHYLQPNDSAKGLIKYIATRDGVELNMSAARQNKPSTKKQKELINQIIDHFPESKTYLEYSDYKKSPTIKNASEFISAAMDYNLDSLGDAQALLKYMSERPSVEKVGSHGLFNDDNKPIILNKVMDEIDNHNGYIWTNVISLHREDAERLTYNNQSAWKSLITSKMNELSKNIKIPINNLKWYGAFHNQSHHPHVHLVVYSTDPSKGYLTKQGIENLRSTFANEIFKNEFLELYKEKTVIRDDLKKYSTEYMTDIVRQINEHNFENPKLSKMIVELSKKLQGIDGKKQYGYLQKPLKNMVDNIVLELSKDKNISELYTGWCATQNSICGFYKHNVDDPLPLQNQKAFTSIKNAVINESLKITSIDDHFMPDYFPERDPAIETDPHEQDYIFSSIEDQQPIQLDNNIDNQNFLYDTPLSDDIPIYDSEINSNDTYKFETIYKMWTADYKKAKQYLYGNNVEQDFKKAFDLFMIESSNENVLAQFDIGQMYFKGLYVEKDEIHAQDYYKKALQGFMKYEIKENNDYIQYRIGKMYNFGYGAEQDYKTAAEWFSKSASCNKFAQYSLASLYYHGKGVEQDFFRAYSLYERSSDQDNAFASYEVAKMLEKGIGVERDINESNLYYNKAFNGFVTLENKSSDDTLTYRVGQMLVTGTGTTKDERRAMQYFEKASTVNNKYAQYELGKLYLNGETIEHDIEQAVKWFYESANNGYDMAKHTLGKEYLSGEKIPQNINDAVRLLTESAEQGNQFAQYTLGKEYLSGEKIPQNINNAVRLLTESAEQGNQFAQYTLGKEYLSGEKIPQNINDAVRLLTESADQGNQFAQYTLGKEYWNGNNIEKNPEKSIDLLKKSAQQGNTYAEKLLDYIANPYTPNLCIAGLLYHLSKTIESDRLNAGYGKFIPEDSKLMKKIMEKKSAQGIKIE